MIAADMLLGDEQRWESLTPAGTAAFFNGDKPRVLVLSRLELDDSVIPCCSMSSSETCNDAVVFVPPLLAAVRLDLFNFQQNVWQAENYATGLLRHGGYELYNPCFMLPLFHNHASGERPNQNENRWIHFVNSRAAAPSPHTSPYFAASLSFDQSQTLAFAPSVCHKCTSKSSARKTAF